MALALYHYLGELLNTSYSVSEFSNIPHGFRLKVEITF